MTRKSKNQNLLIYYFFLDLNRTELRNGLCCCVADEGPGSLFVSCCKLPGSLFVSCCKLPLFPIARGGSGTPGPEYSINEGKGIGIGRDFLDFDFLVFLIESTIGDICPGCWMRTFGPCGTF